MKYETHAHFPNPTHTQSPIPKCHSTIVINHHRKPNSGTVVTGIKSVMEQVHETHKASKVAEEDVINNLPENVVSHILNRLPIQDAVRTDILSGSWRLKWTTLLTQLVFDDKFFKYLPYEYHEKIGKIVSRLLLHLKGPIKKFVFYVLDEDDTFDDEDLNHWILFMSGTGIEELTLKYKQFGDVIYLPTQLYSCMGLKHLELRSFCFYHLDMFRGFPNLLSLHLSHVGFDNSTFGEFIARCPLLEILSDFDFDTVGELELSEISKLGNLKMLYLLLTGRDKMFRSSSIFQLAVLPKLQTLELNLWYHKIVAEVGVDKKVPSSFLCLKTLTLSHLDLSYDTVVSFAMEMICNSPNLQTLDFKAAYCDSVAPLAPCFLDLDCSRMVQLQLRNMVFGTFFGSENEVCFIKYILACSPMLKKIRVTTEKRGCEPAQRLLKLHRASPIAEIELC